MKRIGTGKAVRTIEKHFIVFEGIDGSGTTTQGKLLLDHCIQDGFPAVLTGEPTSNCIGETIRRILKGEEKVQPSTLPLLFAADRNEHVYGESGILQNIGSGNWVICDRYLFSSLAYQSIDTPYRTISRLNALFPLPGILFFLDVPPDTGIERIQGRETKEIFEVLEMQQKVRTQYKKVLSAFQHSGMEIKILDGTLSAEQVHREVWNFFQSFR